MDTITTGGTKWVTIDNGCGRVNDIIQVNVDHSNDANLGPDQTKCLYDTVTLVTNNTNILNYTWSSVTGNLPGIDIGSSGTYSVTTTDNNGCVSADTMILTVLAPPTQNIELVTIDTTNGNNRITWDNTLHGSATSINIYRELTTSNYVFVGTSPYHSGTWTDTVNNRNQAWRYKIAIADTCGNEGVKSPYVQSIHCWVTPNVPSGYNLQWTEYQIEGNPTPVSKYNIYSGDQLGLLQYITFVSGSVTSYTLNTFTDSMYVVGAVPITKAASDDALSNWVSRQDAIGIGEYLKMTTNIYPNPVKDILYITTGSKAEAQLFNNMGQLLSVATFFRQGEISLSELPAGIYHLVIRTEVGDVTVRKVTKL